MLDIRLLAVIIFALTYVSIVLFYNRKLLIVGLSIFILLALGVLTPRQALYSINWNVILLYVGMLFVSGVFLYSKMPDYLATLFTSKAKNAATAMLVVCMFAGFLSVFLDNVTVVLLVAPVALAIARKGEINPVPLFIGMAVSANLQGCATLIGDPPSMLLAGFAKLNFNDFFVVDGRPGIFFAIQVGAIASLLVLYFLFRKYNKKMHEIKKEEYISVIPSVFVILLVTSMVISSSIRHGISYMNGLLCVIFGLLSFVWYLFHTKAKDAKDFVFKLDWQTSIFLMGIFILVESLSVNGVLDYAAKLILEIGSGNTFVIFMIVVWISVLFSAFVDNIPFLVAMLPVTQTITQNLGASPYLLFFGLLVGVSVGGNVTPIGASANIVAMGMMKKQGYDVKFMDFVKIGLPFTIVSVLTSSLFLWLVFA